MTSTEIMPPPVITLPARPATKFERERAAFKKLLPVLLEKYCGKFVAIHDEQVVCSGEDLVTVALTAYKQFGYQPIYVDLVTDKPIAPVRIPHFKPV